MVTSFDELKKASPKLPDSQRAELAVFLLESLSLSDEDWSSSWEAELKHRMMEIKSEGFVGIPAEQVLERLQNRVK